MDGPFVENLSSYLFCSKEIFSCSSILFIVILVYISQLSRVGPGVVGCSQVQLGAVGCGWVQSSAVGCGWVLSDAIRCSRVRSGAIG